MEKHWTQQEAWSLSKFNGDLEKRFWEDDDRVEQIQSIIFRSKS